MSSGLMELHDSIAYHAGRFLAVCQHIQSLTSEDVNATYVDRFFGAACSTPASVLPRIYKVAARRVRKIDDWTLRDDVEATLIQLHQQLQAEWPKHLGIQEQALFQLGFFHQSAALPRKDWRRRILTARGESVKSSGEKTIADILFAMPYKQAQEYEYEETLYLDTEQDGDKTITPDFTIRADDPARTLLIEYTGLIGRPDYDRQWGWKMAQYRKISRTIEDCMADGIFGDYTLMHVLPSDRYNVRQLETRLNAAVAAFLGGKVTPDVRHAWETETIVKSAF